MSSVILCLIKSPITNPPNFFLLSQGKFIRIHFGPPSKIAAADIETYLLEKSRITFQLEIERNYHIFYQLMTDAYPKYWDMCLLGDKPFPGDYFYISQGVLTVAGMDDAEEMRATDTALDTLGFSQDQKDGLYKGTIAIAYMGNQKWKQKGREEQVRTVAQKIDHFFCKIENKLAWIDLCHG